MTASVPRGSSKDPGPGTPRAPTGVLPLVFALVGAGFVTRSARGHESIESHPAPAPSASTELEVQGEHAPQTASDLEVRHRDLMLRPRVRQRALLEVVPGLFAVQHAGGGKASQYFLRGFDADHGTDVALFVDGVPVNMPTHGHGQGYADLHFLIPELVSTLSAQKGPYSARSGDFATAGAIDFKLYDHLHESSVTYQAGRFGAQRGLFMVSPELGEDWSTIVAGEACAGDGPFRNPEKLRRFNGFAHAAHHMGRGTLSLTFMTYVGGWNASGLIPTRAVGTPELPSAFDTLDPDGGGSTQRHMASVSYHYRHGADEARALVYFIRYRFTLYSNFTLFARDPVLGDGIEQDDDRTVLGTSWSFSRHRHLGPTELRSTFGLQARSDSIDNGLRHALSRKALAAMVDAGIAESSVGIFTEQDLRVAPWLRAIFGLRVDRFDVAVKDRLERPDAVSPATSGVAGMSLASPKMSWIVSPIRGTSALDLFVNFGRGFHSNDARGAVRADHRVSLLTKATSYELGARYELGKRLDLSAAFFRIDLDSETVWSGDTGTTDAVGPTRRTGLELCARARPLPWLSLDADASLTKATFRDGTTVPLAPTRTLSGGVSVRHPLGFFGAVRLRAIAARPANEQGTLTAEGFTLVDATVGHRFGWFEAAIDAQNLLNTTWKEAQFAITSRTRTEVEKGSPAVEGLSFTPGWPVTVVGRVTAFF